MSILDRLKKGAFFFADFDGFYVDLRSDDDILRKTFFIFSSKKLDVVTITRYQITFWIFDFSLLEILPKYMNPKIV